MLWVDHFLLLLLTSTRSVKSGIWKRYVDYTFTILDQGCVNNYLQHLTCRQPSIHFIIETETDSKMAFLNTLVSGEPDGRLITRLYRKPTHTDQYLAYSHHPQSVTRGIVKCLYDRAKLVTQPSAISKVKIHLYSALVSKLAPFFFLKKLTTTHRAAPRESAAEFKYTAVLPYIEGLSGPLRRCLQQPQPRSHLMQPKDVAHPSQQDDVVYKNPWECGKTYIGENREVCTGMNHRPRDRYMTNLHRF